MKDDVINILENSDKALDISELEKRLDISDVKDTKELLKCLNELASYIYNIDNNIITSDDIEKLKYIIMSCNILYNRTDMTVLPIEDGFYDLLLEKYKVFDPNFQVGSSVIQFRNFKDNDLDNTRKIIQPVYFLKSVNLLIL